MSDKDFIDGDEWKKRNADAEKPAPKIGKPRLERAALWRGVAAVLAAALFVLMSMGSTISPMRFAGLQFHANDNTVYATSWCTKIDGTTDNTSCLQAAAASLVAGATFVIPAGTYVTTDTVTISKDNVHVVGAGVKSTIWKFNPGSAKPAIKVDNSFAGSDRLYGGSIEGIYFAAGNSTVQKIAIDLVDTSGFTVRNVWVDPASSSSPPWRGSNSIGIRARGRELTVIDNVRIWTDTPILVDVDPYISTPVSCDHFTLSNSYLLSTPGGSNANVKINDAIIVTNFNIKGDNAWIVDKYGLYWSESGGTASNAQNVFVGGIRMEQAFDLTGFGIYIDQTKGLQNIEFSNIAFPSGTSALHLGGNVTQAMVRNSIFPTSDVTKKHLEVSGTKDLFLESNIIQINTTATLTGMTLIWGMPITQSAMAVPPTAWYADSTTASSVGQSLGPNATFINNVWKNTSAANTNPFTFDTTSTFTTSNRLVSVKNAGTEKFFVDSGGSVVSASGIVDTTGATQLAVGASAASSVALGRAGGSGVFVSAPNLACASAGGCNGGGGGSYFARMQSRHFEGGGSAPGAPSAGTGCNTSSAPSIAGTDSSGTVGITCGGTGATSATVFTVAFNTTWAGTPRCILYPANAATAAIPVAQLPFTSSSTSTLTVTSNTTGLAAGTYSWFYKCEQ